MLHPRPTADAGQHTVRSHVGLARFACISLGVTRSNPRRARSRVNTATAMMMDDVYEEGRAGPEFLFDVGRGAETSFCSR